MSEKPSSVTITCQSCKKRYSPKDILRSRGQCVCCTVAQWHLHAEFNILRNGATSPLSSDGSLLTNIGLNAIGIGLLVTTGTGFTLGVGDMPASMKVGTTKQAGRIRQKRPN